MNKELWIDCLDSLVVPVKAYWRRLMENFRERVVSGGEV